MMISEKYGIWQAAKANFPDPFYLIDIMGEFIISSRWIYKSVVDAFDGLQCRGYTYRYAVLCYGPVYI